MAAREETAAQGVPRATAMPLTAETPMRTPVKEPGPQSTATSPISRSFTPQVSSRPCAIGISVWLCILRVLT